MSEPQDEHEGVDASESQPQPQAEMPQTDEPEGGESLFARRPLALTVVWAIAPAMMMALAGVCMALKMDDALPSLLLFFGGLGGIPAMFVWSIWMVYPAKWTTLAKVLAVVPITVGMCAVNLFLAFGACALIDPPFHIQ